MTKSLVFAVIRKEFGIISWGIVNKNMAYILRESFWLSLCDMISVGSHKDCQVLLNAKKKKVLPWLFEEMMSLQVFWWKLLWLRTCQENGAELHQNSSKFSHLV